MLRMTIRFKLLAIGISVALIPMLIVGLFAVFKTSKALESISSSQSVTLAKNLAETIDVIFQEEIKLARSIAVNNHVILAATRVQLLGKEKSISPIINAHKYLGAAMKRLGDHYETIIVTDTSGQVYVDSHKKGAYNSFSLSDHAFFQQAMLGENYVGALLTSPVTGKFVFPVAVPVYSSTQKMAGALVIFLQERFIAERINNAKLGKTGYPFMIDGTGIVQVHPQSEMIGTVNLSQKKELKAVTRRMLAAETGTDLFTYQGEQYLVGFAPITTTGWCIGTSQLRREALGTATSIRNTMLVVILLALMTTVTAMIWLARSILRPIKAAVSGLRDIAEGEGDLTMRLEMHNTDEVGELAHWFNIFIEKLHGIIRQLASNSKQMKQYAGNLQVISTEFAQNAENASEQANNVTASAKHMSTHMSDISAAMEEASHNTGIVASGAEEMSITISEISKNAEKGRVISEDAAGRSGVASEKMTVLNQAAQEIGKVTETITEISEQTNLLALNATIEAARAGEAGKGFTVVANEIKELSKQTSVATQDINNQIGKMQDATASTVSTVEDITLIITDTKNIVSTIASAVEEQHVTTQEIAGNITQTSEVIAVTNENIANSSKESEAISAHIHEVTIAAGEISNSSSQVRMSADYLKKIAEDQSEIVGQFKIK